MVKLVNGVGRVLGTDDATPLEFWVALGPGHHLQLDDVVAVDRELPDGDKIKLYGIVSQVRASHEGARFDSDVFLIADGILPAEVEGLRNEQRVASELGRLLRSDGFERWLLAEAVGDLLDRAVERLLALSNGQYSFDADGTGFDVCDHHNADQKRQAKTLSGGETFLASLALSDSHAEMAPEGARGWIRCSSTRVSARSTPRPSM